MPSVIMVNIWQGIPFFTIMMVAGLSSIDNELYEAASIDGANAWRKFLHVTLPGLKYVIIVAVLLSTIWTFNDFTTVYPADRRRTCRCDAALHNPVLQLRHQQPALRRRYRGRHDDGADSGRVHLLPRSLYVGRRSHQGSRDRSKQDMVWQDLWAEDRLRNLVAVQDGIQRLYVGVLADP